MQQRTRLQGQRCHSKAYNLHTLLWPSSQTHRQTAPGMQVIEVSDEAIVLPLAHQQALVGLLFLEASGSPVMPALTDLTAEALSSSTALSR